MEDIFRPLSLSIKQLFGNADALYQIPQYQRPYSWVDEQVEKLWDDIREAKESESYYFLGSIITAKPEDASNYIDVVDGQQRLTTLLILLCVVRDLYPNLNSSIIETDPFAIDNTLIKTSIKFNDRFERLRLKTHSNHASDFNNLVLKEGATVSNKKPLKKDLKREEEPKYKFMNTATIFTEKLIGIGEKETGRIINYLFNNVKIIRIDCQSVSFAIKLFQVLNDRGLDLSNSDLIKSYLVGRIHKIYTDDVEMRRQKESQFIDDWKQCESIAVDVNDNLNELFVLYEYHLLAENPRLGLYEALVAKFEENGASDPNDIIADFKEFIALYKSKIFKSDDNVIYGLRYIKWKMYSRTILLTALHTNYPDFEELTKLLRRYYFINWIAGNTLSKIKQTSFNIIGWLKTKKPISEIKSLLEKQLNDSSNTLTRAIESLNGEVYGEPWCKPLLFMIEYEQNDRASWFALNDPNIQIEHIIPKAYKKNQKWSYLQDIAGIEQRVNTFANLTLLSGTKNLEAGKEDFDTKIIAYDGTGHYPSNDRRATSFLTTQRIVNDYKSSKYKKEWNVEAINERWVWVCSELEKLLDISLQENKKNIIR